MARIKLKYVNGFSNRDRKSQRVRYYFRRRGIKAIPLPGIPGCEEFMAAYSAALASVPDEHLEIGANRTLPGTINALIVAYYRSDEWHAFAVETKKTRRRIIESFRAQHGEKRVALLQREHIMKMLAAIQKPSAKRSWLKTIRGLMRAAVPTMRKDDPTDRIPGIKLPKSRGHHTWNDDEIAQYRAHWPLGTQQRLVMEFALETASRRGEVVRLGPQHVRNGRIRIDRTHGSEDVDMPMSPALQAACNDHAYQGEALEADLEEMLRARFPMDAVEPVAKGELGADVVHRVNATIGSPAGIILWELKRTKAWSDGWLPKLREDQRRCGADVALIISQALPKHIEHFDLVDNVWVAHPRCALPVAVALRQSLIELSNSRFVQQGQETKMEQVYKYLTGVKFRQRVEAVIEKFDDMREDLERERKFMGKQWSKREAQILAVVDSTVGMVGDLQGIAGKAMP